MMHDSHSLVSHTLEVVVIIAKYVNAVSLCRQEQELECYGLHILRQNMANWTIRVHTYLAVLHDYFYEKLHGYPVLQADETSVQVYLLCLIDDNIAVIG